MQCKNTNFGRTLRKIYPARVCEYCGGFYQKGKTQGITTFKVQKFCSAECRAKGQIYNSGPDSPHWKGGREQRKRDGKHLTWAKRVKERDDYTCHNCGKRGGDLHSHHVLSWIGHPDSRYDVSNGQTLCVPCHAEEHRKLVIASGEFGESCKMPIPSEVPKGKRVETIPKGSTP